MARCANHPRMAHPLLDLYLAQAPRLHAWIRGLTPAQMDAHPISGTWSIRQCVIHTLDSDLIASHRMKRVIAEEKPLLIPYDETLFANVLYGPHVDVVTACNLFQLSREHTAQVLRDIAVDRFERAGVHAHRGILTVSDMLRDYVAHVSHHEKFVAEKRAKLGAAPIGP